MVFQQQHRTFRLLCSLLCLSSQVGVRALSRLLARDGLVSSPPGYQGTIYQAIRYEPLCGTLGDGYTSGYATWGKCGPIVMDLYSNNTDTFAIYDESGVRLAGAIVGGGLDLCMCFSLRTTSGREASDMCWWITGDGLQDTWSGVIGGSYHPGSGKSLPHCTDIDLASAQAAWSATAATRTVSERTRTLGVPSTATSTVTFAVIQTSTVTPSMVTFTTTRPTTITESDGRLTTSTETYTTALPVLTINKGLSVSDRISLGVGLGVGVPSLILALLAVVLRPSYHQGRVSFHRRYSG